MIWSDAENTCGNPAPVVDAETGTIFLLSTWNLGTDREPQIIDLESDDTRRVYLLSSTDEGETWSEPEEITGDVKLPEWTWYATGPGSGIQLTKGAHAGRLMGACDHIEAETKHYYSHVIFSDDHGQTWQLGGSTPQYFVNESEVAELEDGSLLLNMRNYARDERHRKISRSFDGGMTWTDLQSESASSTRPDRTRTTRTRASRSGGWRWRSWNRRLDRTSDSASGMPALHGASIG